MSQGRTGDSRQGRQQVLDAARVKLAGPTLSDLLSFLTKSKLAKTAAKSASTASYHFPGDRLSHAVIRDVLNLNATPVTDGVLAGLEEAAHLLREGTAEEAIQRIRQAAIEDIISYSNVEVPRFVMIYLASAAAPHDEDAAEAIRIYYDHLTSRLVTTLQNLFEAWGREPVDDFDYQKLAVIINALADGFVMRRRFDPGAAPPEIFGDATLSLAAGLTRSVASLPTYEPVYETLLPPLVDSNLDVDKRVAIADAASELYRSNGWEQVTISSVAVAAGVDARTVKVNFGDRSGLAAAVWASFLPSLEAQLQRERRRKLEERIRRHLIRLGETVSQHRPLTSAFFNRIFSYSAEHGAPDYMDPADPRTIVPLPTLIAPILYNGRTSLREGLVEDEEGAAELAAFLTHAVLHRTLVRPSLTPSVVVDYTLDICLRGAIRRVAR